MSHRKLTTLFFAGTDTDVGKTYTAAMIAGYAKQAGYQVGVYKPVASGCQTVDGCLVAEDAAALWHAAGCPRTLDEVCPQRFVEPLAPPLAAAAEGKQVDPALLRSGAACWEGDSELLIVEGAGGLLSPLADGVLNIDLVKQFADAKLLIVAANRLGAIHQTLSTCAAAELHGVKADGIILCDPTGGAEPLSPSNAAQNNAAQNNAAQNNAAQSNAAEIQRYTDVPVLGSVSFGADKSEVALAQKLLI